jgi:hypothetical protein
MTIAYNSADSEVFPHRSPKLLFGRPQRQMAADGGFASQENLKIAKDI